MSESLQKYLSIAKQNAFSKDYYAHMNKSSEVYNKNVGEAKLQYAEYELAKTRAAKIKRNVINDLEKYLIEFEANFQRNGGKLIWAVDANEAVKAIADIITTFGAKNVIKSKSNTCQEINLAPTLSAMGLDWSETDFSEQIMNLSGESSFNNNSLYFKSRSEIAALMNSKFNISNQSTPNEIASFMRNQMRDKFVKADIAITGANFMLVDTGSVAISENEGNVALGVSAAKIHIALIGIEKILPSIKDLDLFLSLLSTNSTGQDIANYNIILSGPRQEDEIDGPQEMFVILLDNGRSKVLARDPQKDAMSCIHCGACHTACQVYKNIGGEAYQSVFNGPIGSVISPLMFGFEEYGHLSYACTLCGKCDDVCPVQIPLSNLLLFNRRDYVKEGFSDKRFSKVIKAYKFVMSNRWILDKSSAKLRNYGLKLALDASWGTNREFPKIANQSFSQFMRKKSV